ncbi:UNVERIFIED_CONTAM: hypothetical protein RMT77_001677 [Armadillidium vulgare]
MFEAAKSSQEEQPKFSYTQPKKAVFTPKDIEKWEKSSAYQDILGFLTAMNESVRGKKLSYECHVSTVVKSLSSFLDVINDWIDECPPIDQPQRYGNKAFRQFYEKLKENTESCLKEHLPSSYHEAIIEISTYLIESFGNSTRIDYGTGHELSFIMFLCALHKIGALKKEDSTATVIILFKKYISLCRKLQMIYKMEPAGSQGVWSLDDYQFIPFIWGSSQLIMHPKIAPEMFTKEKIVEENANEYLFLSCIQYILSVKTGPFAEHSNQLWNISGVKSWTKINQGLFKMYKAEILNKFPVIQHVLFGSIFTLTPAQTSKFLPPRNIEALKVGVGLLRSTPTMEEMPVAYGMMASGAQCTKSETFAKSKIITPAPPPPPTEANVKKETKLYDNKPLPLEDLPPSESTN